MIVCSRRAQVALPLQRLRPRRAVQARRARGQEVGADDREAVRALGPISQALADGVMRTQAVREDEGQGREAVLGQERAQAVVPARASERSALWLLPILTSARLADRQPVAGQRCYDEPDLARECVLSCSPFPPLVADPLLAPSAVSNYKLKLKKAGLLPAEPTAAAANAA